MEHTLWKTVWWYLKKLKIELPYNLETLLRDTYSKEIIAGSQRDIYLSMLTAALFAVTKMWTQSKLFIDEWISKIVLCIHAIEYYSASQRERV